MGYPLIRLAQSISLEAYGSKHYGRLFPPLLSHRTENVQTKRGIKHCERVLRIHTLPSTWWHAPREASQIIK